MRIMHTDFLRGWGGQPNRILMESEECVKLGAEILIAAPIGSELGTRAKKRGMNVNDSIAFRHGFRWSHALDFGKLRRLILSYRPDILHVHGGKDSWLLAEVLGTISRKARPVVVRTKHNIFPIRNLATNRWLYCRFFDYLVALSNHIKSDLVNVGIPANRIAIIPSAYDGTRFNSNPLSAEKRQAIRAAFGFTHEHTVCIATGRCETEKGFNLLIDAAKEALSQKNQLRFLLVGDGRLRPELEAQCARIGLDKSLFVFAGFRDNVPDLLKCADLAIVPSISEGLGTVSLEAGICGLPVLASRCGGLTDVVNHEKTGLLFETGNRADLISKLLLLSDSRETLHAMGTQAAKHISKNFSPSTLGENTVAYYKRILEETRSHG